MPATKTIYPYTTSYDLQLRPYDPFDPTQEEISFGWLDRGEDGEMQKMDLTGRADWRKLRIQLDANLPRAEMEDVLGSGSDWKEDTSLLVSVRCAATKFRRVVELAPGERYTWTGDVTVRRADVRSTVELHPLLVRTTGIPTAQGAQLDGRASLASSVIATGRALRLTIDPTDRSIRGSLDIKWDAFAESEDHWRRQHARDLFFLDPHGDEPCLWLNSSYYELKAMLDGRSTKGVDAALRHLTNGAIAQTVWMQLFLTAAGSTMEAMGDDGPIAAEGWKKDVLTKFLPRLFPEEQTDEDRVERLKEMFGSPGQMATLMSLMGTAVQEVVDTGSLFDSAVRAVEGVAQ